jgi:hypothetical protein
MRTEKFEENPEIRSPLTFEDVALAAAIHWCVTEKAALRYLRAFDTPRAALKHVRENFQRSPDAFWESL